MDKHYEVGQRVRAVGTRPQCESSLAGKCGTIVHVVKEGYVSVQWDDWKGGHDCGGRTTVSRSGYDMYSPDKDLKIISDNSEVISMNSISPMAENLLDADTKALMQAGYIDSSLNLTSSGIALLDSLAFGTYKADMVKDAKAKIKEAKDAKK